FRSAPTRRPNLAFSRVTAELLTGVTLTPLLVRILAVRGSTTQEGRVVVTSTFRSTVGGRIRSHPTPSWTACTEAPVHTRSPAHAMDRRRSNEVTGRVGSLFMDTLLERRAARSASPLAPCKTNGA